MTPEGNDKPKLPRLPRRSSKIAVFPRDFASFGDIGIYAGHAAGKVSRVVKSAPAGNPSADDTAAVPPPAQGVIEETPPPPVQPPASPVVSAINATGGSPVTSEEPDGVSRPKTTKPTTRTA